MELFIAFKEVKATSDDKESGRARSEFAATFRYTSVPRWLNLSGRVEIKLDETSRYVTVEGIWIGSNSFNLFFERESFDRLTNDAKLAMPLKG